MPEDANVFVYAPLELAGASIQVNGRIAGQLWPDGVVQRSAFLGIFARTLPHSRRAVSRLNLDAGRYELTIEKDGYRAIRRTFVHPKQRTTEIVIDAAEMNRKLSDEQREELRDRGIEK